MIFIKSQKDEINENKNNLKMHFPFTIQYEIFWIEVLKVLRSSEWKLRFFINRSAWKWICVVWGIFFDFSFSIMIKVVNDKWCVALHFESALLFSIRPNILQNQISAQNRLNQWYWQYFTFHTWWTSEKYHDCRDVDCFEITTSTVDWITRKFPCFCFCFV